METKQTAIVNPEVVEAVAALVDYLSTDWDELLLSAADGACMLTSLAADIIDGRTKAAVDMTQIADMMQMFMSLVEYLRPLANNPKLNK